MKTTLNFDTGDSEEDQETRIVKNYSDFLNTDVLKVGHHGSRTSSGDEFMTITSQIFPLFR